MAISGGHMAYVLCPSCDDPVAGSLPAEGETLECVHCHHKFPFETRNVRSGIVVYDEKTDRWRVGKPHGNR